MTVYIVRKDPSADDQSADLQDMYLPWFQRIEPFEQPPQVLLCGGGRVLNHFHLGAAQNVHFFYVSFSRITAAPFLFPASETYGIEVGAVEMPRLGVQRVCPAAKTLPVTH
jgi:hypothetical protein